MLYFMSLQPFLQLLFPLFATSLAVLYSVPVAVYVLLAPRVCSQSLSLPHLNLCNHLLPCFLSILPTCRIVLPLDALLVDTW